MVVVVVVVGGVVVVLVVVGVVVVVVRPSSSSRSASSSTRVMVASAPAIGVTVAPVGVPLSRNCSSGSSVVSLLTRTSKVLESCPAVRLTAVVVLAM